MLNTTNDNGCLSTNALLEGIDDEGSDTCQESSVPRDDHLIPKSVVRRSRMLQASVSDRRERLISDQFTTHQQEPNVSISGGCHEYPKFAEDAEKRGVNRRWTAHSFVPPPTRPLPDVLNDIAKSERILETMLVLDRSDHEKNYNGNNKCLTSTPVAGGNDVKKRRGFSDVVRPIVLHNDCDVNVLQSSQAESPSAVSTRKSRSHTVSTAKPSTDNQTHGHSFGLPISTVFLNGIRHLAIKLKIVDGCVIIGKMSEEKVLKSENIACGDCVLAINGCSMVRCKLSVGQNAVKSAAKKKTVMISCKPNIQDVQHVSHKASDASCESQTSQSVSLLSEITPCPQGSVSSEANATDIAEDVEDEISLEASSNNILDSETVPLMEDDNMTMTVPVVLRGVGPGFFVDMRNYCEAESPVDFLTVRSFARGPEGEAAKAVLRQNDRLMGVDDISFERKNRLELFLIIKSLTPGKHLFTVRREA